mmetsp:Transcript_82098/g.228557  ORF Transcript_82098/g.228557 Transcript_82098/m.228557 type:complete len:272 (-) Transcript_82098:9-824(-)
MHPGAGPRDGEGLAAPLRGPRPPREVRLGPHRLAHGRERQHLRHPRPPRHRGRGDRPRRGRRQGPGPRGAASAGPGRPVGRPAEGDEGLWEPGHAREPVVAGVEPCAARRRWALDPEHRDVLRGEREAGAAADPGAPRALRARARGGAGAEAQAVRRPALGRAGPVQGAPQVRQPRQHLGARRPRALPAGDEGEHGAVTLRARAPAGAFVSDVHCSRLPCEAHCSRRLGAARLRAAREPRPRGRDRLLPLSPSAAHSSTAGSCAPPSVGAL